MKYVDPSGHFAIGAFLAGVAVSAGINTLLYLAESYVNGEDITLGGVLLAAGEGAVEGAIFAGVSAGIVKGAKVIKASKAVKAVKTTKVGQKCTKVANTVKNTAKNAVGKIKSKKGWQSYW